MDTYNIIIYYIMCNKKKCDCNEIDENEEINCVITEQKMKTFLESLVEQQLFFIEVMSQMKEKILKIPGSVANFFHADVNNLSVSIRREYFKYVEIYGPPVKGIFDPCKLQEIIDLYYPEKSKDKDSCGC